MSFDRAAEDIAEAEGEEYPLSFPNTFQPPISIHYCLNPATRGAKEMQPAAASHTAQGRARPTQGMSPPEWEKQKEAILWPLT